MRRWFARFAIACAALVAAPLAAQADERDYPEPPPLIAERIVDGRFEPGNFEYLRGYFPEASDAQKAQYSKLSQWLEQCSDEGRARLDAKLAELGVALSGEHFFGTPNICGQVIDGERFKEFASFEELVKASRGARLVFDTLVQTISRAERGVFSSDDSLGAELQRRTMGDQMLRNAFYWGWAEADRPGFPKMTDAERTVFMALLGSETLLADHRNTNWLKGVVDEQGWPTISKVGEDGARAAWLLTQHADMDPAFQLRALRLMEPLIAEEEVSRTSYAYLYDRVMLKLKGKQRYGTQVQCVDGERIPRPLEEADRLDELRAEMGMGTFAQYRDGFRAPCSA